MMELRWLKFSTGDMLQYRQRERNIVSTMSNGNPTWSTEFTWTEWQDVPIHLCGIVDGKRVVVERAP